MSYTLKKENKNQKNNFKYMAIIIGIIVLSLIVAFSCIFIFMGGDNN